MPITHHTKQKGDLGVAKAHAEMVSQGFMVLVPATEHAPFDLVAYDGKDFHRIQVKYRTASKGAVTVQFRAVWSDRSGVHRRALDKADIDVLCVYCPDTDRCYFLDPASHASSVTLRVAPPLNGRSFGVLIAEQFRSLAAVIDERVLRGKGCG